jgi:hypothetical protein
MIIVFDRLALSIGKVYLLLASLVLFAVVLLYRRYGRYLGNLDRVETMYMGLTMMANASDMPGVVESRVKLIGYIFIGQLILNICSDVLVPILKGLVNI